MLIGFYDIYYKQTDSNIMIHASDVQRKDGPLSFLLCSAKLGIHYGIFAGSSFRLIVASWYVLFSLNTAMYNN